MAVIKCKMCGGDLQIVEGNSVCECEYCGSKQTVPTADNEKKMTLFTRANRLLRNCEFDKASGVFESIVAEFPEEAEAYWGLVLCKYGIEYVDDPATGKKVPTCHRSSFDSVLDDPNFEQACENTDAIARRVYRDEARQIEALRQAILQVSGKEDPYDIFISYKETDENGDRTLDSVVAQDIYKELTNDGYRVFFSRISLEDKLGAEYEPYIFAALNSAKVMLVVGTDYENFDSVWVKNEWSRFLKLIASGQKKTLIPVFKNMDAYDMPKEFAKLAAQDMGKVGAMQDLLHGVEKLLGKKGTTPSETAVVQSDSGMTAMNAQTSAMLKRGYMMLRDGDYAKADDFFERVLNNDAECTQAYWGKTLAEAKVPNAEKYGSETLFRKLKAQEKSVPITVEPIQTASLARRADDSGLLKHFQDEELRELLSDIDSRPVQYQNALPYYQQQEQIYSNTVALHALAQNHDFARASQYADESFHEVEKTVLKSLRASIADAMDAEKKKEMQARCASENKKMQIINTVKSRLSGVKQEQERNRNALEAACQEAEKKADAAFREATAKFERDYQLAVQAQENDYQHSLALWQQKKADFDQNYDTTIKKRKKLEECITHDQEKLRNLTGLFIGRKRKELESNISLLRKKLDQTVIPQDPGPKPPKPATLQKGKAPVKEDFLATQSNVIQDIKEQIKCSLSPKYKAKRAIIDRLKDTVSGQEVQFGLYPTTQKGMKEPITWLVLSVEGKKLLLISKYALDCQQYNNFFTDVTWETCSLRKWLNGTFLCTAFSKEERAMIPNAGISADKNPDYSTPAGNSTTDQVFLLSIMESNKYFGSNEARKCSPTPNAVAQGTQTSNQHKVEGEASCWWWLRSPGDESHCAAFVSDDGRVYSHGNYVRNDYNYAVRPSIWVNLEL